MKMMSFGEIGGDEGELEDWADVTWMKEIIIFYFSLSKIVKARSMQPANKRSKGCKWLNLQVLHPVFD